MNSRYWRNVGSVLSGTAVAQALPILASLVLTRLFAPQDFGLYAAWLGLVSILGVVLTGRFELALVLEADGEPREHAMYAIVVILLVSALLAAAAGVLVWLWVPTSWLGESLPLAGLLLPASMATAAVQSWLSWAAANGDYRSLSAIRIAQSAAIVVLQLLAGAVSPTGTALALAHLAGLALTLSMAAWRLPLRRPRVGAGAALRSLWRRHRNFPMLALPADSLNMICAQLPVLIVTSRFGAEVAGYLALTLRTLGVSSSLLGNAVLDVFKRDASSSFRDTGECRNDFLRTFRVLTPAAVLGCLLIAPMTESLYALAFGESWRVAGTIALWLLPMFALRLVASPLSYTFYIAGKQHYDLIWQIVLLLVALASLYLPLAWRAAIQLYSLGFSMMYLIYLFLSYRFSLGEARSAL